MIELNSKSHWLHNHVVSKALWLHVKLVRDKLTGSCIQRRKGCFKVTSQQKTLVKHRKLSLAPCADLEGWDGGWGEREVHKKLYVDLWLHHIVTQAETNTTL